ncbi:MAG TPA: glycosyltransferase family 2 protein [Tepidisphaeraceae bacterium]|jgi:hypothetical protein
MPVVQNSVVIVSCNKKKALWALLKSLKIEEATTSEVIVVDSASFDGSADMVAEDFPQVQLIRCGHNRGFASAAGRGIAKAMGQAIVLCHGDIVAEIHTLVELADRVRMGSSSASSQRVVAAVPRIVGVDGAEQPSVGRLPGLGRGMIGVFNPSVARKCYTSSLDHVADHEWTTLTCMAIDAEALTRIGSLDPQFFLYWADADLCQRIHDRGYRIAIRRDVKVTHTGRSPNDPLPDELRRLMRRDQRRYFAKHRPAWEGKLLGVDEKIYKFISRESA